VTFCWSKKFKLQFEGFRGPIFKASILFVYVMELVSHKKTLPTDPDGLFDQIGLDWAYNVGFDY
jgi:hypothetical protein